MSKITGAEILIESLRREKVKIMFGYPGGVLLPFFDKLYDTKEPRFILTRHEQGAAHAADGYARATGKVGVCIATSGPGATNLVTGIATAYMDSIPMVAITGQVMTTLIGNDAFQEADITGITRPITKHNFLVKDVKDLANTVKEAFHIARSGRPGPVVIDLPVDVQKNSYEFHYPKEANIRSYCPTLTGHKGQIKRMAKAIEKARKPILYVGGGVIISGAEKELAELVRKTGIPVTCTLMAIGAFPGTHKLNLGMPGMHGTAFANHAIQDSDLLIAVGSRFDDRVTGKLDEFAKHAKIIHIDIDPSSVSKNVVVDIPCIGDAKEVLKELLKDIKKKPDIKNWVAKIDEWRKKAPLRYKNDDKLRPQYVVEELCKATKGNAIITTEVGQNQMWAAQYYTHDKPRTFLTSGGLGTMGYGLPAAIGAKLGKPDKIVFDIAGDGSIQMNIQELATAVQNKIHVKIAVLNNCYLGMVRQWQELFFKKRYSHTFLDTCDSPNLVKLAESYGAVGIRVTKKKDVRKAIERAIKTNNTVLIDFKVEEEENVMPMVPAGQAINRMIGGMA
ncbi:MAG: biosynthetic-type acetolactate synthase large subunit [Candidatus Omnitrophica bacterium]|nr:biosynthetic-type acetolactate synthase large subunit [Candidatus Omnitrophota bacterium]